MLQATIEAEPLSALLAPTAAIVDECRVQFSPEGVSIRAADPAVVATVDASLAPEAFETYETDGTVVGVTLERLMDVTAAVDAGDVIDLAIDDDGTHLRIDAGSLSYTLGLIDTDSIRQEPDLEGQIDFPASVAMDASMFDRGVRAAAMVTDHLRLELDDGGTTFTMRATGDTDEATLSPADVDVSANGTNAVGSLFSLEYLQGMNRAIPGAVNLTIEFGEAIPARLSYAVDDHGPAVTYLLAPRLQQQ